MTTSIAAFKLSLAQWKLLTKTFIANLNLNHITVINASQFISAASIFKIMYAGMPGVLVNDFDQ